MKAHLDLEIRDAEQLKVLLLVAKEMGIGINHAESSEDADDAEDRTAKRDFLGASFKTMEKEWLAPENDHWDEFIAKRLKL